MTNDEATTELRRFQRHQVLRQYGDDGQVLPECLRLSEAIDALFARAEAAEAALAAVRDKLEYWAICEALRCVEACSVTLLCDNPDFNGQPNNAVECNGDWTDYKDVRFTGDTILGALQSALDALKKARALKSQSKENGNG